MKRKFLKLKLIFGTDLLSALMIFNVSLGIDSNNKSDINLIGVEAEIYSPTAVATGGDNCATYGFRNWNTANPLNPDGYDCQCVAREDVKRDCQ